MEYIQELCTNKILIIAACGWFSAGVLKVIIELLVNKKINLNRVFGAGGMPSSHTSTVVSLAIAVGYECGLSSPFFAIAVIIAIVVVHDAVGVRQEAGKQAKILNFMIFDTHIFDADIELDKRLKEYIGHTPFQVLVGAIVGIINSCVMINIMY